MRIRSWIVLLMGAMVFTSCVKVVRPGQVGVKRRLGKLSPTARKPGIYVINPFVTRMIKVPVTTNNLPVILQSLPSKEGLNVEAEFSVIFHIKEEYAVRIIETIGLREGKEIMMNTMRSAAANVTSKYNAKDLHTAEREKIGSAIAEEMVHLLGDRGFIIEAVLLKSIKLPPGLYEAIEMKMRAEQDAQRMIFVLESEKLEAQRKRIEAEGIRDAQKIIQEGLTPEVLQYQSIEAFRELSTSPNAKTIITNGQAPLLMQPESKP